MRKQRKKTKVVIDLPRGFNWKEVLIKWNIKLPQIRYDAPLVRHFLWTPSGCPHPLDFSLPPRSFITPPWVNHRAGPCNLYNNIYSPIVNGGHGVILFVFCGKGATVRLEPKHKPSKTPFLAQMKTVVVELVTGLYFQAGIPDSISRNFLMDPLLADILTRGAPPAVPAFSAPVHHITAHGWRTAQQLITIKLVLPIQWLGRRDWCAQERALHLCHWHMCQKSGIGGRRAWASGMGHTGV